MDAMWHAPTQNPNGLSFSHPNYPVAENDQQLGLSLGLGVPEVLTES